MKKTVYSLIFTAFFFLLLFVAPTQVHAETKVIPLEIGTFDIGGQYRMNESENRFDGSKMGYSILCGGGKNETNELRLGLATGGWNMFYPCDLFRTNGLAHIEIIPAGGDTSAVPGTNPIQIITAELTPNTSIDTMQVFATDHLGGSILAVQIWGNDGEYYSRSNNINSASDNDNQSLQDFCGDKEFVSENHHSSNDPKLRYCYSEPGPGIYEVGQTTQFTGLKKIRLTVNFGASDVHVHFGSMIVEKTDIPNPTDANHPQCKGFNTYAGKTAGTTTTLLTPVSDVFEGDYTKVVHENADKDGVMDRQAICWTAAGLSDAEYATGLAVFSCQTTCSKDAGELGKVLTRNDEGNVVTVASSDFGITGNCETRDASKSRGSLVAKNENFIAALPSGVRALAKERGVLFVQKAFNFNDPPEGQFCTTNPYKGTANKSESGVIWNGGGGKEIFNTRCGVAGDGSNCTRRIIMRPNLTCTAPTISPTVITNDPGLTVQCIPSATALSYKLTYPTDNSVGTTTSLILDPSATETVYLPTDQISSGTYRVSCVPCTDAEGTICSAIIPSCQASFTINTDDGESACELGAVSNVTTPPIIFQTVSGGALTPITVNFQQALDNGTPTLTYELKFTPSDPDGTIVPGSSSVIVVVEKSSTEAGVRSVVLNQEDVVRIHSMLEAASKSHVHIQVTPQDADGTICPASDGVAGNTTTSTQNEITVRVRDSAICDFDSASPPGVTGTLTSTWAGGSQTSPQYSFIVNVPTGVQNFNSSFTFSNPDYRCSQCDNQMSDESGANTTCTKEGFIQSGPQNMSRTLYVTSQPEVASWWEVIGGLAYGNQVSNTLPLEANGNPQLCGSSETPDRRCAPYQMRSPSFITDNKGGLLLANSLSLNGLSWSAERSSTSQRAVSVAWENQKKALIPQQNTPYDYFLSLIPSDKRSQSAVNKLTSFDSLAADQGKPDYFVINPQGGTLTIDPTNTMTVNSPKKIILFVDGNLVIGSPDFDTLLPQLIDVKPGGFLALIVKGNITVRPSVGTPLDTSQPTVEFGINGNSHTNVANLAGIYIANGTITIESNSISVSDKRFLGEGTFASLGSIRMNRSFGRESVPYSKTLGGYSPTEVFRHRPDLVLATPREFQRTPTEYSEIR